MNTIMKQMESQKVNKSVRVWNAATAVEKAAGIAASYLQSCRGPHGTTQSAVRLAASRSGLTEVAIRKLVQPSRKPKSIGLDIWTRLVDAYSQHLYGELSRIEAELQRLHALGAPEGALADLLDRADALADEIRHALQKTR